MDGVVRKGKGASRPPKPHLPHRQVWSASVSTGRRRACLRARSQVVELPAAHVLSVGGRARTSVPTVTAAIPAPISQQAGGLTCTGALLEGSERGTARANPASLRIRSTLGGGPRISLGGSEVEEGTTHDKKMYGALDHLINWICVLRVY